MLIRPIISLRKSLKSKNVDKYAEKPAPLSKQSYRNHKNPVKINRTRADVDKSLVNAIGLKLWLYSEEDVTVGAARLCLLA